MFSSQDALNKALTEMSQDKTDYILALVKAGANYKYQDGYRGKQVELMQISETIRYILNKIGK